MNPFKVIFWDVYGTLVSSRVGDLESMIARGNELAGAFGRVAERFSLRGALRRLNPSRPAGELLRDLYIGAIAAEHEQHRAKGVRHPEVRIEEIWRGILQNLGEKGWKEPASRDAPLDYARKVSLFFEQTANPRRLYPNVSATLLELRRRGVRLGIVSNAQFYTSIQLEEMFREQSAGKISRLGDVFDRELLVWSCDLGVAKPDPTGLKLALEQVGPEGVAPAECAYVGNDMLNDVWLARELGMFAVLFAGDPNSLRWRRDDPRCAGLKPDRIIHDHKELLALE